jgi:hypothetical protein
MAKIDLTKISNTKHVTTAKIKIDGAEAEITIHFRGITAKSLRELQPFYLDTEKGLVDRAGYLSVYVTDITEFEGVELNQEFFDSLELPVLEAIFDAVDDARNPKESTPSESPPAFETAKSAA